MLNKKAYGVKEALFVMLIVSAIFSIAFYTAEKLNVEESQPAKMTGFAVSGMESVSGMVTIDTTKATTLTSPLISSISNHVGPLIVIDPTGNRVGTLSIETPVKITQTIVVKDGDTYRIYGTGTSGTTNTPMAGWIPLTGPLETEDLLKTSTDPSSTNLAGVTPQTISSLAPVASAAVQIVPATETPVLPVASEVKKVEPTSAVVSAPTYDAATSPAIYKTITGKTLTKNKEQAEFNAWAAKATAQEKGAYNFAIQTAGTPAQKDIFAKAYMANTKLDGTTVKMISGEVLNENLIKERADTYSETIDYNDIHGTKYVPSLTTGDITYKGCTLDGGAAGLDAGILTYKYKTLDADGKKSTSNSQKIPYEIIAAFSDEINKYMGQQGLGIWLLSPKKDTTNIMEVSADGNTITIKDSTGTNTLLTTQKIKGSDGTTVAKAWNGKKEDGTIYTYGLGEKKIFIKGAKTEKLDKGVLTVTTSDKKTFTYMKFTGSNDWARKVKGDSSGDILIDITTGKITGYVDAGGTMTKIYFDPYLNKFYSDKDMKKETTVPDSVKKLAQTARFGPMFTSMGEAARAGQGLSSIFGWDQSAWSKSMASFFSSNVLGQLISGNWEDMMCSHYIAKESEGVSMIMTESGLPEAGVYIAATRVTMTYENDSTQTSYNYRIEYMVKNPDTDTNDQDNSFNIYLHGSKTVPIYVTGTTASNLPISAGQTISKTGSGAIYVTDSRNSYTSICIQFSKSYTLANGETKSEFCNSIIEYSGSATHYSAPASTPGTGGSGSGGEPQVNPDL